ncbi:MAG: YfcC family protein [Acidobacteriota bacterium]|nr:YfcC family protein [Acidobacteriota bacterium]
MTSRLKLPHPLALLVIGLFLAAALSHILPAGEYTRRHDPVTGRDVVVAGTFHAVPAAPVGFFQTLVAVPRGMEDAGSVIFFVFLVGGAFAVVERTGTLGRGVDWLVARLADREALVIPVVCLAFATAGALENMQEEIIALVPVLLLLTRQLGFDPLTAAAMSVGAAAVGSAFSPVNPFQAGIAQKLAGLPLLSGASLRLVLLAAALGLWIWGTLRHARRVQTAREARTGRAAASAFGWRERGVLALVLATFAVFVYGVLQLGWDFDQMSALFFLMGILAGLLGGLGVGGTSLAFVRGFEGMAYAGILIGFARAIYVVLDQGRIIDTIVHGLFTPIGSLPLVLSAVGMTVVQALIHIPVPSVSGQAVLTMPVLVPLSDLLGLSRQLTVLTYQIGAGLCELMTPTNGALMAVLAAAGVEYEDWLRFVTPLYAGLVGLGLVAVAVGLGIGWH